MNEARHDLLGRMFSACVDLPVGEREDFLRAELPDDPEAVAEVLALLEADAGVTGTLGSPTRLTPVQLRREVAHPERIGSYAIVRMLGEGGMGRVYLARQERPQRDVAVKLLRWSGEEQALERFGYEAELLGRMRHPGIAQIHEAGVARIDGQELPYFALEYVDGKPIDRYAREAGLSTRQRLELIARLCEAVEHAHRQGIVHRDLKPANVLVTADGQPKVLDFGIARTLDREGAGASLLTRTGQVLGTLAYMAPEQARGDSEAVDWRADVHALGVLAYELVSGTLPYDLAEATLTGALRILANEEPIPIARRVPRVDRELALLLGKAIDKLPERRYASALAFADDIRRYLANEPIEARPPTVGYLTAKFVARHRGLSAGLALTALAVLVGSATSVSWALRAGAAERDALVEAETANEALAFVQSLFRAAAPEVADGEELTVRQVLDSASGGSVGEFAEGSLVGARIDALIGDVRKQLGDYPEAAERLERAVPVLVENGGADDPHALDAMVDLAEALYSLERTEAARESLRAVLDRPRPADVSTLSPYVRAHRLMGTIEMEAERYEESLAHHDEAVSAVRAVLGAGRPLADALIDRVALLNRSEQLDAALADLEEAQTAAGEGANLRFRSSLETLRGEILMRRGELVEARACFERSLALLEEALDPLHPHLMIAYSNLASVNGGLGDLDAAEALLEQALEIPRSGRAVDAGQHARALQNYGNVRISREDFDGAQGAWEEALAIWIEVAGERSAAAGSLYRSLAALWEYRGDEQRAAEFLEKAAASD